MNGRGGVIEEVQEFVLKDEGRGQFELAYGPGGAWSNLFARSPGFRGMTVLRDTDDRRRYLTITVWASAALRAKALAECSAEYADLKASLNAWTESVHALGVFRMLAEATVRPIGGPKAGKRPAPRRGSGRGPGRGGGGSSAARE
jgi:hypothetical protein